MPVLRPVAFAAVCAVSASAQALTLTEDNVESRFVLGLQADAAAIQKRLPPDLEVLPNAAGPLKDANVLLVFYDRQMQLDGAGKQVPQNMHAMMVVTALVKVRSTGKPAAAPLRIFHPRQDSLPGFYKSAVLASVDHDQTVRTTGVDHGSVKDEWRVSTAGGDRVEVRIEYTRSTPARAQREAQIFSIVQPNLYRIYRWDETTELVRSVPGKVDHATKLDWRVSIADMRDIFVPGTRVIGAVESPVFLRKVFVPEEFAAK